MDFPALSPPLLFLCFQTNLARLPRLKPPPPTFCANAIMSKTQISSRDCLIHNRRANFSFYLTCLDSEYHITCRMVSHSLRLPGWSDLHNKGFRVFGIWIKPILTEQTETRFPKASFTFWPFDLAGGWRGTSGETGLQKKPDITWKRKAHETL